MNVISDDLYFRQGIRILLAGAEMDYSGIVCVDGGQVIAFFRPSVTTESMAGFFDNCFLVVDKHAHLEKLKLLLAAAKQNNFHPVYHLARREIRVFSLLTAGKSTFAVSASLLLPAGTVEYIRHKTLQRSGFRHLNILVNVMLRLKNGLKSGTNRRQYA
ncbi:hypothetical protein WN774_004620 [Salmonella enterica subsp. enterica serovar Bredeney]